MENKLTLYKAGNSICSHKVLITLAEKRLEFETVDINLFENEQYSSKYLQINPKGVVPALVHNGSVITESTLICEYLEDYFSPSLLVPSSPIQRASMRKWSKIVDEGLFEATREISFSAMFREKIKSMSEKQKQARFRNIGDPDRNARYVSTFELGVDSPYVYQAVAIVDKAISDMERTLSHGKPWLLGDKLSLADINMMPFIARLSYLCLLDIWTGQHEKFSEWWESSANLKSFQVSISDALTETEIQNMRIFGLRIRGKIDELRKTYISNLPRQSKYSNE